MFKNSRSHLDLFETEGKKITAKSGQIIVDGGGDNIDTNVYLLKAGTVKVTFTSKDGTERILAFYRPGGMFAQPGSFFNNPTKGYGYSALEDCEMLVVPRERFFQELENNLSFTVDYLQSASLSNLYLLERLSYQGEKDIRAKLCKWLLFMVKYYSVTNGGSVVIDVPMTQDTIASFLHLTRESVNKTIRSLIKNQLIEIKDRKIRVLNLEKIKSQV